MPAPLIFFSGLAADADVFTPQRAAFPQLEVVQWPCPREDDTLDSYSARIAADMEDQNRSGIIFGGASFGGIIAQHVAQYTRPRAIILIGSIRSPAERPRWIRMFRPLKPLVRLLPIRVLQFICRPLASKLFRSLFPLYGNLCQQFQSSHPSVFKWSIERILDWERSPDVPCPVFHIHGSRDRVLPSRYTKPDVIVEGGGHVISLTHPSEVNAFIRKVTGELDVTAIGAQDSAQF